MPFPYTTNQQCRKRFAVDGFLASTLSRSRDPASSTDTGGACVTLSAESQGRSTRPTFVRTR